mgnify:CR=1 FL=1
MCIRDSYYAQQIDDLPQLLAALRKPLPITFRIFDATRDGTSSRLEAEAVKLGATRLQAKGAWTFAGEARRELRAQGDKARDGALRDFLVRGDRFRCLRRQEEVSMASVEALAPRPNDVVLDCCAAPGSKTTQLVERCEGGCVVAVVPGNVQRAGLRRADEASAAFPLLTRRDLQLPAGRSLQDARQRDAERRACAARLRSHDARVTSGPPRHAV